VTDPTDDLSGRAVLVVGASSGIGRALVIDAARRGARVVAVARRAERLRELVADAGDGAVVAVEADVTEVADCDRLAAVAADVLGPIDLMVYAAGSATLRRLADMSAAEWARILATNVGGFNHTLAALVPDALAAGAVVAALSSEVVGRPRHGLAGYGVSKAALEESVRAWRLEQPQIRFCRVGIGATQPTDFGSEFDGEVLGPILDDWVRNGLLPTTFMDTDELAAVLARLLGSMLAYPGIAVEEVLVRSPAPPMTDVGQLPS